VPATSCHVSPCQSLRHHVSPRRPRLSVTDLTTSFRIKPRLPRHAEPHRAPSRHVPSRHTAPRLPLHVSTFRTAPDRPTPNHAGRSPLDHSRPTLASPNRVPPNHAGRAEPRHVQSRQSTSPLAQRRLRRHVLPTRVLSIQPLPDQAGLACPIPTVSLLASPRQTAPATSRHARPRLTSPRVAGHIQPCRVISIQSTSSVARLV
jgi:hypothetical protein